MEVCLSFISTNPPEDQKQKSARAESGRFESGLVKSGRAESSRVGSGRVGSESLQNLARHVGVGLGDPTRPDPTRPGMFDPTRE